MRPATTPRITHITDVGVAKGSVLVTFSDGSCGVFTIEALRDSMLAGKADTPISN